ncbi:discoidin domain-containing protein [Lewinella sp. IMCC34183]|uniref:discoidin domain-containing protein n=1 Tax=Lewinella sp. IMCC34183 TaxID=2248762 RepID=UPI000E24A6D3|nr:discoidin domain-containing protein [Lewinella sp. IMCC34183]
MSVRFTTLLVLSLLTAITAAQPTSYCNPINIDYGYTPFARFAENGRHRTTADPVIVNFRDTLFLFSTNQEGYWYSADMSDWTYVHRKFLRDDKYQHDLNAPAAWVMQDTLYVYGSTWELDFPIWKSGNPTANEWEIAVDTLNVGAWDPAFLYEEEEDKLYLYWGSSNEFPLLGTEITLPELQTTGITRPIMLLHPQEHGWERFGEYNDNVFLPPFTEGAWVTKHDGKYYFQYAAPGTEFSGYADGVLVSSNPLGGFRYQQHNPFSYKPGGFARGAGHGSTFTDAYDNYWHVSTMVISVKNNFERRLGIWPAGFDEDGVMYSNTAFGDYPTLLPASAGGKDFTQGLFAGWMLLNYQKPVQVSSTFGGYHANYAVDEDIKTYWSARTGDAGEWLQTDLGAVSSVRAIQINYADQDVEFLGKTQGNRHQYVITGSVDGEEWDVVIDKRGNQTDVPHDYVELPAPVEARYLRIENVAMPTGKFAISGLRVFGTAGGERPDTVENFVVLRSPLDGETTRMASWMKWKQNPLADGYNIYFGKAEDKLYGSIMVYGANQYYFTGMDKADAYYFQIEAFNASGISERTQVTRVR